MKQLLRIIVSFAFIVIAINRDFEYEDDDDGTSRSYEGRRRRNSRGDVPLLNLYPHYISGPPVEADPLGAYRVLQLLHQQNPYTISTPVGPHFIHAPIVPQSPTSYPAPLPPTQLPGVPQKPTTVSTPTISPDMRPLGDASSVRIIRLQRRRSSLPKSDNPPQTSAEQEEESRKFRTSAMPSLNANRTLFFDSIFRALGLKQQDEVVDKSSDVGSQVPVIVGKTGDNITSPPRGFRFMVIKFFSRTQPISDDHSDISSFPETTLPAHIQNEDDDHEDLEPLNYHIGFMRAFLKIVCTKVRLNLCVAKEAGQEQGPKLDYIPLQGEPSQESDFEDEMEHAETHHDSEATHLIQHLHDAGIFDQDSIIRDHFSQGYVPSGIEDKHQAYKDEDERSVIVSTCEECTKDYKYFYCGSTGACIHHSRFLSNSFTGRFCPVGEVYYYKTCTVKSFIVTFFIGLFFLLIFSGVFAILLVVINNKRSRSKLYQRLKDKEREFKKGGEDFDAIE